MTYEHYVLLYKTCFIILLDLNTIWFWVELLASRILFNKVSFNYCIWIVNKKKNSFSLRKKKLFLTLVLLTMRYLIQKFRKGHCLIGNKREKMNHKPLAVGRCSNSKPETDTEKRSPKEVLRFLMHNLQHTFEDLTFPRRLKETEAPLAPKL